MENAVTSRSPAVILDELLALKDQPDVEKAIALCREAAKSFNSPADEPWYPVRFNLAVRLRLQSRDECEEAIDVCQELLAGLPLSAVRERANIQSVLASAYNSRQKGNIEHNLQRAETARLAALKYFSRDVDPEQWALLNTLLGALYLDMDDRKESDVVVDAIKCFENALEVFTATANPELHEENAGLLREAMNKARSRRILAD